MKKFLLNKNVQKSFLPLTFVCLLPVWIAMMKNKYTSLNELPPVLLILGALAVVFFLLNMFFKPYELERAEQKRKKAEEVRRREVAAREKREWEDDDEEQ